MLTDFADPGCRYLYCIVSLCLYSRPDSLQAILDTVSRNEAKVKTLNEPVSCTLVPANPR